MFPRILPALKIGNAIAGPNEEKLSATSLNPERLVRLPASRSCEYDFRERIRARDTDACRFRSRASLRFANIRTPLQQVRRKTHRHVGRYGKQPFALCQLN